MSTGQSMAANPKHKTMASAKRQKLFFYISIIALPLMQFSVFYLYVNLRSFTLGFQVYESGEYVFAGFENFAQIFKDFQTDVMLRSSITNSLTLFFWTFIFGSFGAVLFSYYIYKKFAGSTLFKIMLYLPHILGGVVVVIIYKYFTEDAIREIFNLEVGLLSNVNTERATIMFYTIYVSFGPRVLVYSSAMSGISESIIESAELDGVNTWQELVHIVLPSIWSTFVTFMVASVVGIFTNQMSLYTFYGEKADSYLFTFGYYLYRGAKLAKNVDYPYLSAMGLMLTVIAVPMTLFTRWALNKFGPSKD